MPPVLVGMTVVARAVAERTSLAPRSACVCGLAGALLGLADLVRARPPKSVPFKASAARVPSAPKVQATATRPVLPKFRAQECTQRLHLPSSRLHNTRARGGSPRGSQDQLNNSFKAAEPTGLLKYRSIPASRASSRPGWSLLTVSAISLRFCSCGCCERCRATS